MISRNLTILAAAFASVLAAAPDGDDHVPGRLLVQTRLGANPTVVAVALARAGARLEKTIGQIGVSALQVPEAAIDRVSAALMQTGLFTFVEKDHFLRASQTPVAVNPNDPNFPSQWHLSAIQSPYAWSVTQGSSGVVIAVIDSGADWTHPDLSSKLVPGWNFLTGTSNTQDSGGDSGHGTAVSGTAAAATNDGLGVAGVGWSTMVMPLEVLDSSGSGTYSNLASAINYAADHGARIINVSLCGSSSSSTLQSAESYAWNKGSVIFAAAGNNANSNPVYPAADANVVAVSATDVNGTFASFSTYGSWIDLSAPGNNILTTMNGSGYGYWYGTSFASPIAAGVAALVLSLKPGLSNSSLVSLMEHNADDLGTPGWDQYFGYGQVNAYKTVLAAQTSTVDTTPPTISISSPANSATVSGAIQVQGTATDNVGVTSIHFSVDGVLVANAASSPFAFSWNSAGVTNGNHTLSVSASDAAGNVGTASVLVTVSNQAAPPDSLPPVVSIIRPTAGSRITTTNVQISVSATDNVGVVQVSIYVDGTLRCTDTVSPYTCTWNAKKATSGNHVITANAWDAAGNMSSATPVTVTK
jgi:subtilisin family serine protease